MTDSSTDEAESAASHAAIAFALAAAGLGAWDVSIHTGQIKLDDAGRTLLSLPRTNEYTYQQILSRVHPYDLDRVLQAVQWATNPQSGGACDCSCRIIGADDGRLRRIRFIGRSYFNQAGEVYRCAGVAQDVTNDAETHAIRPSEERYYSLFQSIDEAYSIVEVLFDADATPVDYRVQEANPAFEKLTGLRHAVGKTMRELVPTLDVSWIEPCGAVALTGEARRFGGPVAGLANRWFDGYAFRLGDAPSRLVAVRLCDITERKRREANGAFLAQITDEFTRRLSAEAIMQTVGARIGQYLNVASVNFLDIDESAEKELTVSYFWGKPGVPILLGQYHIRDFLTEEFERACRAGETYVINDTQTDPRTDAAAYAALAIGAYVNVPFHYQSRWTNIMAITDTQPRVWRADELELFGELANRIFPWLQRARAQEALRQSEERLQVAIKGAHIFTWEVNPQTGELLTSPNLREVLGFELTTDAGENVRHIHPDDYDWVTRATEQALASAEKLTIEHRLVNPQTGETIWVQVHGQLVPDNASSPGRFIGITQNITGHKLAELAVEESRTRLQKAIQIDTVGVLFFDDTGRFLEANDAFLTMTGYSRQQFEEQLLATDDITLPEWMPRTRQALDELKTKGQTTPYEKEFKRPDGSHWWGINAGTRLSPNENVEFIVDVSGRKQAEDSLRQADRRKDEFLATLAHELRNPLAPLSNTLQLLKLTAGNDQTLAPAVAIMVRQVDHLIHLVDDLLDVSRISQGKLELRRERIDLRDVVSQVVDAGRPLYEAGGRELTVTLPNRPIYLNGDRTRLVQMVSNLLNNATKFTHQGGHIWLTVERAGQPSGDAALLRVRDDGIGIAPDQLETIFELFTQADHTLERSRNGLGLGLTLVRQLVELHGGRVEAHSKGLGQGSQFTMHLPALAETTTPQPAADTGTNPTSGYRILVVDDNPDAAVTLAMLLKRMGHQVHIRFNGREGIAAVESLHPEVVVLDIGMPGINGYDTARLIRAQPGSQSLVLIALTGYGQADDRRLSQAAGFDAHLVKPVDMAALTQLLSSLPAQRGNP